MNPATPHVAVFADETGRGHGRDGANPGGAGGLIEYVSPAEKVTRLDYWISEPGTTNNRMALRSAIEALRTFYGSLLPVGGRVLDLMSSWRSHLPHDRGFRIQIAFPNHSVISKTAGYCIPK